MFIHFHGDPGLRFNALKLSIVYIKFIFALPLP